MHPDGQQPHVEDGSENPRIIDFARRLHRLQQTRADALGAGLFADPAWDILLDLFVSYHDRRRLSVSAVCVGIKGSPATGLRYIAMLQALGLVRRIPDEHDGRRSYVDLTKEGSSKLLGLLARFASA